MIISEEIIIRENFAKLDVELLAGGAACMAVRY